MALRRRRKKLTNLLSSVDRRLKNVELRGSKGSATVGTVTDLNENNNIITPPAGVISDNTPNPWVHVIGGYWYPAQKTGAASGLDRVELWFEADPLTEENYGITVSGVDMVTGYANPSGTYNVIGDDYPWTAPDRKSWYKPFGNTITHTALYTTGTTTAGYPYIYGVNTEAALITKAAITSTQANTTTATLTFSGGHHFNENDIISVRDLGSTSPYYGIDGIFKVVSANTVSNTITYTFDTPLANAIPLANVTSKYAYGVAQKQVDVGNTWVNSADGLTYYWNGIRYVKWTEGALVKDNLAPKPPTSLVLTTTGYNLQGGASGARSRVKLEWTAPTQNTDDSPLEDLVGYRVWYRTSPSEDWLNRVSYGAQTTQTIDNLNPNVTYYFAVIAYDSSGMESTALTGDILTGTAAIDVTTPAAPNITISRLGVVSVTWDGTDSTGGVIPANKLAYIEVHASTVSGFTPTAGGTTLKGRIYSSKDFLAITDLTYNTAYYIKFIAVDVSGNATAASAQVTASVTPLVDADLIAAQLNAPLTTWPFANATITAGALASGAVNSSNMFGNNVVVQAAIAANAIGADQIAAGAVVAGKILANSITSAQIAALSIEGDRIAGNAIDGKTITGATFQTNTTYPRVVMDSNGIRAYNASNSITFNVSSNGSVSITSYATSSDLSSGLSGKISTGGAASDINANTTTIDGGKITANTLEIGNISVSTALSGTLKSALTGQRVEIAPTQVWFYGSTGSNGYISGTSSGIGIFSSTGSLSVNSTGSHLTGNSSTIWLDDYGSGNGYIHLNATNTQATGTLYSTGNLSTGASLTRTALSGGGTTGASFNNSGDLIRTTSSIRYKTDVSPLTVDYQAILALEPKKYKRIEEVETDPVNARTYAGFIAEDLENTPLDIYVFRNQDGTPEGIHYAELTSALVIAIKHQDSLIKSLEDRISALENK